MKNLSAAQILAAIQRALKKHSKADTIFQQVNNYTAEGDEMTTLPMDICFSQNSESSSRKWRNRYFGKQFSILGDSISTLDGYHPVGYNVFYAGDNCIKSGVNAVEDTWWGKVIGYFGGELLVNNSWSGSRVTKLPGSAYLFPSGCSDDRASALHTKNLSPNVIIVYLGTNDWAYGVKTGNETKILGMDDNEYFDKAYGNMIKKIKTNYPNAEIWCCTLCATYMSRCPDFKFPHRYGGTHIEEYNDIIRATARHYGCRQIDLYRLDTPYDSIDGTHPNSAGMNTIATMIICSISQETFPIK